VIGLRVAIVGGGLAGITAALECADAGAEVTLYESRPRLGGATFSVRKDDRWLDNGQHVALRCCTAYRRLLQTLGTDHLLDLQPRLSIPVVAEGGRSATFARTGLPAPLHLTKALLGFSHLSLADRLGAARAVRALQRLDLDDARLDEIAFAPWLREHGQSQRSIDVLWNLITLPTLNLPAEEASLALGAFVFRVGVIDASDACDLAVPRVPLRRLHGDAALAALEARNVTVRLRTRVGKIRPVDDGLELDLRDGPAAFDRVIAAVPHQAAPALLPNGVVDAAALERLGTSAIVNVHLHFDRPVLDTPFLAAVDSPLQWLFDRTESSGVDRGQLVSISLSAADGHLERTQEELVTSSTAALERLLPSARGAGLLWSAVTREPAATFRGAPGSARLRPPARTHVPGLALAGAWTDTRWPATMESAVRSGHEAAREVLSQPRPPRRNVDRGKETVKA
jgi:squalene-associated FAD-dependent desaturase